MIDTEKGYPWLKNYPKHVPAEIDVNKFQSVVEVIEYTMTNYRRFEAYENMGKVLTFDDIDKMSIYFASFLQHLGLKKGDRIAIQMPNILQYPVVLFGALRAGLVIVNMNPLYTRREMEHQLKDAGAKAIVILANFADKLEDILPNTEIEHIITTEIGDLFGGLKKILTNFVVKYIKKMVPNYHLPKAISFNTALKQGQNLPFQKIPVERDDIGFLQYTGGTTGISKGAMLSHGNLISNLLQNNTWWGEGQQEGQEIAITALPLYHIFAFTVNCFGMMLKGGKCILITNPRDLDGFIKELKKHPFTIFVGVNTLYNALLNHPKFKEVDFSYMHLAVAGGMALQKIVNERWKKLTGKSIIEGYGLSETSPVLSVNPIDGTDRVGTIGLPVSNTILKIIDEAGNEAPLGSPGEITAKGPQVMKGYWNRPDETEKSLSADGWFKTGDIGVMDEDGFFKIVDRKKDMILVSGFNVYPNEVEDVIATHEDVIEVAAIGVPDEKSTEAVKVFIVRKNNHLTEEVLIAFCKKELTGYKRPKHVEFVSELPKTNVGKILRRKLKEKEDQSS